MKTSAFQQAIESVESLPLEDQEILLDILQKRLHLEYFKYRLAFLYFSNPQLN